MEYSRQKPGINAMLSIDRPGKPGHIPFMNGPSSIERALTAEAHALEGRLAARDAEFRQLQVIRRALAELAAARTGIAEVAGGAIRYANSISEAAQFLIEEAGEPLAVAEIFAGLPKYGKMPAGDRPQRLLSNYLSADSERFESVQWKGKRRWWVKGVELPKEEA
jgi:hypothetical protein